MALVGVTDVKDITRQIILRGLPPPDQPNRYASPRVDL
jgi:hypothetical protein